MNELAATLGRMPIERWEIVHQNDLPNYVRPIPRVSITHVPEIRYVKLGATDEALLATSRERKIALNTNEMRAQKEYFARPDVIAQRKLVGLTEDPTDAELEVGGQSWSEHCKHKIFNAKITYHADGREEAIDSLFNTYIKSSTKTLERKLPWVVSTLWDNSGVVKLTDGWLLAIKCETHNSPSKVEPYSGAITGIVGVYRDPMGTGLGARLIYGTYGFCTGIPGQEGEFVPGILNADMLEGVREGVQDGGNKSGIPTPYGVTYFHKGFMAKPAIFVLAAGLIPEEINGRPGHEKKADPGDLIVMCGGRVGIDGIHGATESSMEFSEAISTEHVQMGDPFTQKKMLDFLIEARDLGYYKCITDNGAGGLSSSVGEMGFMFADKGGANGFKLELDKVPLKYQGLDPWQILVSESQERMTLAVDPLHIEKLKELARLHEVDISVIGSFNNSGKFHCTYGGKTVTYLDMDFVHNGVPQMELRATWSSPEQRGLYEPSLPVVSDHGSVLRRILSRPNIASKEYIVRQFDHEVQGTSVIKPLVGKESDVHSDAAVIKPLYDSDVGIAIAAGINPAYSEIDTYHMTACAMDEAIRRVIAVGGSLEQIPLNDNFCWPNPIPGEDNPDAEYKLAQLVRANQALYDYSLAFETPCVSGKDSMSMDGKIKKKDGTTRLSAPPTVQFSAAGKIKDVNKCVTMDVKNPGDVVYVLGTTRDELGGSEFYEMHGKVGLNVPKVDAQKSKKLYNALSTATSQGYVASIHGCYKGGLAVALAQTSFAGGYGLDIDLRNVHPKERDDPFLNSTGVEATMDDTRLLYSESAGRFVVTVNQRYERGFEEIMNGTSYRAVGRVTNSDTLNITGLNGKLILRENINQLKGAYKSTFAGY
jgi:phosphoribosylformylglycinamidine synthase